MTDYSCLFQYLEKNGMDNLTRDHFSFSTKIFIGEFLKPTGLRGDDGEEKYVTLNEDEMADDVDKIRKENGWKPRKRPSATPTPTTGPPSKKSAHDESVEMVVNQSDDGLTPEQRMLQRLQTEVQYREKQMAELRLQKEAIK